MLKCVLCWGIVLENEFKRCVYLTTNSNASRWRICRFKTSLVRIFARRTLLPFRSFSVYVKLCVLLTYSAICYKIGLNDSSALAQECRRHHSWAVAQLSTLTKKPRNGSNVRSKKPWCKITYSLQASRIVVKKSLICDKRQLVWRNVCWLHTSPSVAQNHFDIYQQIRFNDGMYASRLLLRIQFYSFDQCFSVR